jgi:hypothetical protein
MNQRVDTHTHMSDGSFGGTGYSAAEYVAKLDEFDVMRAWISPCSGLYANGESRFALLIQIMARRNASTNCVAVRKPTAAAD